MANTIIYLKNSGTDPFDNGIPYLIIRFLACPGHSAMTQKRILLFAVCAALFTLHQIIEKIAGIHVEILDSYLDPLLIMPILLTLLSWERALVIKDKSYRLPWQLTMLYFVVVSILGEVVLPNVSDRMTADPYDVACYALGTILYLAVDRTVPN